MYSNPHTSKLPNLTFIRICSIFKCPVGGANQIGLTSNLLWHHKIAPSRIKCPTEHFFSQKVKISTPYSICMA